MNESQTVEVNAIVAEIDGDSSGGATGSQPPAQAPPPPAPVSASDGSAAAGTAARAPKIVSGTPVHAPEETRAAIPAPTLQADGHKVRSSPLVRRIAKEKQVDLAQVKGTGLGGRISKKYIVAHIAVAPVAAPQPIAPIPITAPAPTRPSAPQLAAARRRPRFLPARHERCR